MKGKNLYLTAVIILLAGIIFIITANNIASFKIVIGAGVLFILAGLANMVFFLGARDKEGHAKNGMVGNAVGWVASAAAIVLGVCMLLFQNTFVPLVSKMFAVLLMFTAVFQICLLAFGSKPIRINSWFFLVPVLLFGAAVFIFLQDSSDAHSSPMIMYVTGGAFALFGLASLLEGMIIANGNRKARRAAIAARDENTADTADTTETTDADSQESA